MLALIAQGENVLSFLKKKPKLNNEANQDLSLMLFDNSDDPVRVSRGSNLDLT